MRYQTDDVNVWSELQPIAWRERMKGKLYPVAFRRKDELCLPHNPLSTSLIQVDEVTVLCEAEEDEIDDVEIVKHNDNQT